ncbi:universal stress protein [Algoriphagus boritolerans]|uniref:universal stress protein n=1 Tax=Algoriphagus boritolerans TaxID=308111 RepID=UPI002FCE11BD
MVLGSVFKGITESIAEQSPDLIVMGSKGASGLEEVIVGSNTEKVVRTATCPVVTIKAETDVKKMKKNRICL